MMNGASATNLGLSEPVATALNGTRDSARVASDAGSWRWSGTDGIDSEELGLTWHKLQCPVLFCCCGTGVGQQGWAGIGPALTPGIAARKSSEMPRVASVILRFAAACIALRNASMHAECLCQRRFNHS